MSDESFKPRNPKKEHFTQEMISIYNIQRRKNRL
jgi:hypothetical protein